MTGTKQSHSENVNLSFWTSLLHRQTSLAPLAVFRILFGLLMLFAVIRFWSKGWIYDLYIAPDFHFKYYGFEWLSTPGETTMYMLFAVMALSALMITLGLFYRIAATLFFLAFTYVELLDVANYLNHYYFVSLISFLMIFLPANGLSSLDIRWRGLKATPKGNHWYVNIIRFQLAVVYIYAGMAKLNYAWLIEAMPLKMWLPANSHLPLIGWLLDYEWVAYAFSWFGALYDLTIPFFLWNRKTRPFAFLAVIVFHVLTWTLFPIGVFPWVMIFSSLIFFSDNFHKKILSMLQPFFGGIGSSMAKTLRPARPLAIAMVLFICWQLVWPWRFVYYPGNLFWTEQGYRFGWRVMLMEKAGYINYRITDPESGRSGEIDPSDYLTINQEKQLATQPDLILQFAHFLEGEYKKQGIEDPAIYADAYVTLNGQGSRRFIDPEQDLTLLQQELTPKNWILPYEK